MEASKRRKRRAKFWKEQVTKTKKKESNPKSSSNKKSTVLSKRKKKIKGRGEPKVLSSRGFRSKLADTSATQTIRRNLTEAESESELCKATSVRINSADTHSEYSADTHSEYSGTESRDERSDDCSDDDASKPDATGGAIKTVKKKRFIVFLGNLPSTISRDDIITHFEKRGVPISEFRLLTHKDSGKSKGCGFMELSSNVVMQNALKFHRSRLLGKHINMEVTCGGGGKGTVRRKRILDKNRKQRLKKAALKPAKHKTVG